ncbi:serine/threonine protein kinase [Lacrimispora sp.]|uniref:serine/threonine protein kinase n=1 Tax=Lacrimispora sp. TaxID=2719234 RepID=UPI0028AE6AE2|nr:serine/threonine protein kinase [Lacrimispora sp.]
MENREKKLAEKEKAREKNEVLIIKSVGAAIALGEATATALKNGHCNGETEAALQYAREIKHEQKDFLAEQVVKNLY